MSRKIILNRINFIPLIISSFFILQQVSCSGNLTPVEHGIASKTLYIGNQTEPQDLDPHIVTGNPEFYILQALFEGLVIAEPKHLTPQPGTARSWEISTDGLVYTFHLRSNAFWSNGDRVTAGDFVFSSQRILSPGLGSEYAYMQYYVKGAESFHKGETTVFSTVGIVAADDTTLVITLARPTPFFLSLLTHHSWYPVHRPTILRFGKIDTRGTEWTRPEHFVGNGPFTLSTWTVNTVITVKKNPRYWDSAAVALREINFYPIDNMQTEERAFRTGAVHITSSLPSEKIEWYRTNRPEVLRINPILATYFYIVNTRKPPLDNILVRRALSCAIDRKAIVEHILKGGQLPATCFTPPGTGQIGGNAGYHPDSALHFDTVEAQQLMHQAGYGAGGKPFPPIELLYNTNEGHHTIAQAVQQMWKQYLGIEVTLVNQEWKVFLNSKLSGEFDVARMGWSGDYNDPMTFLDLWLTGGGNNNSGWSNLHYDSCIAVAASARENGERFAAFAAAERILLEELPIIPFYFYTRVYLLHPAVKGWDPNILDIHNYKFVDLVP